MGTEMKEWRERERVRDGGREGKRESVREKQSAIEA